jgi:hypothetical protein
MPIPTFIFPSAPALSASAIYALDVFADKPVFQPESASFTRATTATRTNSSGLIEEVAAGIARVDWSGSGAPNTLLEPQRTNLVTWSEDLTDIAWNKLASTITGNSTTSPSGLTNADTFSADGTFASHLLAQTGNATNGVTYTHSVYAKKGTNNFIQLVGTSGIYTAANVFANFDLNNGVVGSVGAGATATITSVGNGWYRCTMTATATATTAGSFILPCLVSSATASRAEANTLTTSVFLWGAQLEAGAYATSYIPTTSTSVTRNADAFTLSDVYTSGKITSAGGTWFVDLRNNIDYTADTIIGAIFLDTTPAGYVEGFMFRKFASGRLIIRKLIASSATTLYTTTSNTPKVAIKWNGTTADIFENGSKVVSASAFTPTAMQFLANTNNPLYANINSMALYSTPLSDADCIELTTL